MLWSVIGRQTWVEEPCLLESAGESAKAKVSKKGWWEQIEAPLEYILEKVARVEG